MTEGSVMTIISGHERYGCRLYYHGGMGTVYHDSTVIVDRRIDEEYDWAPGVFGISEPVFVAAEDSAFEGAMV